jgi:hypothetical protein
MGGSSVRVHAWRMASIVTSLPILRVKNHQDRNFFDIDAEARAGN